MMDSLARNGRRLLREKPCDNFAVTLASEEDSPAGAPAAAADDPRRVALVAWLGGLDDALGIDPASLRPASSDASFRRYFRVDCRPAAGGPCSLIAMDAPPAREDSRPFVHIAALLAARGVHTPRVHVADFEQGFLLLSDLGLQTYADALQARPADVEPLYADALATLVRLQIAPPQAPDADSGVPPYDRERLLTELRLFPDWYLARHLEDAPAPEELAGLDAVFEILVANALGQPQVLVHRDYHCRNLMRLPAANGTAAAGPNPGVLDFQDAVIGPITYDLVSLLRDAYVEWPEAQQLDWAVRYWEQARAAGLPVAPRYDDFWRDLEWMSLQRSLKVLGIFARLCYRDGKSRYLGDLPVVLRHARRVAERYGAFAPLARLFERLHPRTTGGGFSF
jgi:aminoglycoside/choline kinase family phosphotransferase